jgi:regulator of protease activity HflC (stomatin/prohibitin superfamily)
MEVKNQMSAIKELPKGVKKGIFKRSSNVVAMRHEEGTNLGNKRIVDRMALVDPKKKIDGFTVREYEAGILLQLGRFVGVVPSGLWAIDEDLQQTGTEIIWVDTTDFKVRWGFGNQFTADNKKIGANGEMVLHVSDPQSFVMKIVSSKQMVERDQLEDFILGQITTIMRVLFRDFKLEKLLGERETFQNVARAKLHDTFVPWGLEMVNLEVLGFNVPEEFEMKGSDETRHERELAREKHQLDLERQRIETEKMKREFGREQKVADAHADSAAAAINPKGASAKATGSSDALRAELKDLDAKLDELEDKLDRKEISEDTFKLRAQRLHEKINQIKSQLR